MSGRTVIEITKEFNTIVIELVTLLRTRAQAGMKAATTKEELNLSESKKSHATRLASRVATLLQTAETGLIALGHQKIIRFKDNIIAKDEQFFLTKSANDLGVTDTDIAPEALDEILNIVKSEYLRCSVAEKTRLQNQVIILLKCSIEYALI